jgi:hypothetical protein
MVLLMSRPELLEEPDIVFEKQTNILNLVFQHGDTLYPHPKGKAGKLLTVNIAAIKYIWVNHATA